MKAILNKMNVTYDYIMSLKPSYDFKEIGMPTDYNAPPLDFINDYQYKVKCPSEIIETLLRKKFMTDGSIKLYTERCLKFANPYVSKALNDDAPSYAVAYHAINCAQEEMLKGNYFASIMASASAKAITIHKDDRETFKKVMHDLVALLKLLLQIKWII